jgi:capsular exopolysaccharide synthesis family protein
MWVVKGSETDVDQVAVAMADASETGFDVRAVLSTLWRRKWQLVALVSLLMAPIAALVVNLPPKYTATATVVIDPKQILAVATNPVVNAVSGDEVSLQTEIEMLRSAEVAQTVIEKIGLIDDPEFSTKESNVIGSLKASIESFVAYALPASPSAEDLALNGQSQRNQANQRDPLKSVRARPFEQRLADTLEHYYDRLSVAQSGQSRAILISFTADNPEKAATIANTVVDSYVEGQLDGKISSSKRANIWLDDRVIRLRDEVVLADQAVEDYRIANNLDEIRGQEGLDQKALAQLQDNLLNVRFDLAAKEARLERIRDLAANQSNDVVLNELDDSPLMIELRQAEAELSRRQAQLAKDLGPNHPQMVDIEAQRDGLTEKITREVAKIVENLEFETDIARKRESDLVARIAETDAKTDKAAGASIQLRELERDADAKRKVYEALLARREELQEQQELLEPDVAVIARATAPLDPSFPNIPLFFVAGFIGSSCIGLALIALLEHLDRTVRKSQQLETLTGVPTLAAVPKMAPPGKAKNLHQFLLDNPLSMYAEAVKSVAMAVEATDVGDSAIVLVTSSKPSEGKTTFAMSLTASLACSGAKTAIIDMDVRHPSVVNQLTQDIPGTLNAVLDGEKTIKDVVIEHASEPNFHIIACEHSKHNPSDLYRSERLKEVLGELRQTYRHIIIDCPPIVGFTETQIAAQIADMILFMVQWGKTTDQIVLGGMRAIHGHRAKIVGSVMTQVDLRQHAQYEYQDFGKYYKTYEKYYTR